MQLFGWLLLVLSVATYRLDMLMFYQEVSKCQNFAIIILVHFTFNFFKTLKNNCLVSTTTWFLFVLAKYFGSWQLFVPIPLPTKKRFGLLRCLINFVVKQGFLKVIHWLFSKWVLMLQIFQQPRTFREKLIQVFYKMLICIKSQKIRSIVQLENFNMTQQIMLTSLLIP